MKQEVKTLIDVHNIYTEQIVRNNIEFHTEIEMLDSEAANEAQVARNFIAFICNEVKVKKNPEYEWASYYIKYKSDELTRCCLEVVFVE